MGVTPRLRHEFGNERRREAGIVSLERVLRSGERWCLAENGSKIGGVQGPVEPGFYDIG